MHISKNEKVPRWLWASLAITALLCLFGMSYRFKSESKNKAVAIAIESEAVRQLAAADGIAPIEALPLFAEKGANALVISEETLGGLESQGKVEFGEGILLVRSDKERVQKALSVYFPQIKKGETVLGSDSYVLGEVPISSVRQVSLGLNEMDVLMAKGLKMEIIARLGNPEAAKGTVVQTNLQKAIDAGATVFLPLGDQVIGRRGSTDILEGMLKDAKLSYATPEFNKIAGDTNILEDVPGAVIRLHTAQIAELDKLTEAATVERFVKAATERGQRILLLRPLSKVGDNPVDDFAHLIQKVKRQVLKEKLVVAEPHPYTDPGYPRLLPVLIGLSVIPAAIYMLGLFFPSRIVIGAGIVLALASIACYVGIGKQVMTLVAAVGYPLLSFVLLDKYRWKSIPVAYAIMTLVSLIGGLCVSGMLVGLPYMVRADVFQGVKIAHFVPIIVVFVYYLYSLGTLKESVTNPIKWLDLVGAFAILGLLAFMISRTGNDNPAGVSGTELQMRALLENVFPVRPRTKEFLIGHPLLILGIGSLLKSRISQNKQREALIVSGLLAAGAIGQTSVVNTMCHLHTPLTVGLIRIVVGWIMGGILGLILWGVSKRFLR